MDLTKLVLPGSERDVDVGVTAARGRARLRYLQETKSTAEYDDREYAQEIGIASLRMLRSSEVGYRKKKTFEEPIDSDDEEDEKDDQEKRDSVLSDEEDDAENLILDIDWDTTGWTASEIQQSCQTLVSECEKAKANEKGQQRRELAQRMLLRLLDRHREARDCVEKMLENIVNHTLPGVAYGLDLAALNLVPLVLGLAQRYQAQLVRINVVRRIVALLLAESQLSANLIQAQTRLHLFYRPNHFTLCKDDNERRRKWFTCCMDLEALLKKWRSIKKNIHITANIPMLNKELLLKSTPTINLLLFRATSGFIQLLEILLAHQSIIPKKQFVKNHGVTAIIASFLQCPNLELRSAAMRLLLLVAAEPTFANEILPARPAELSYALIKETTTPLILKRLALELMHTLGTSAYYGKVQPELVADHLALQPWLQRAMAMLSEDTCLFIPALRYAQRCALASVAVADTVALEFMTNGAQPMERAISHGLQGTSTAALELIAQLTSSRERRAKLQRAGLCTMLTPLLALDDPQDCTFLKALLSLLFLARSQENESPVQPGSLGDADPCVHNQIFITDQILRLLKTDILPRLEACAPVLLSLRAAPALLTFLCQPHRKRLAYELSRRHRTEHCRILHSLFELQNELPRVLFEENPAALLRFAGHCVQVSSREPDHCLDAALRLLCCVCLVTDSKYQTFGLDDARAQSIAADATSAVHEALLESRQNPRALVENMLLTSGVLSDIVSLLNRPDGPEHELSDIKAAAAALIASAAPVPISFKLYLCPNHEPPIQESISYAAADKTLLIFRKRCLPALVDQLSPLPLRTLAASCLALARICATPEGAEAAAKHGVISAAASLMPQRPVAQANIDAVLTSTPLQRILDGEHPAALGNATALETNFDACKLLRLPVTWYTLVASLALSPEACFQLLERRVVQRCAERFAIDSHKPTLDWAVRLNVATLFARITRNAAVSSRIKKMRHRNHSAAVHDIFLTPRYRLAPLLLDMLKSDDPEYRLVAADAVASLCSVNVAAAVPCIVDHDYIPTLVSAVLSAPHTVLRHALVAIRAILRYPSADYAPQFLAVPAAIENSSTDSLQERTSTLTGENQSFQPLVELSSNTNSLASYASAGNKFVMRLQSLSLSIPLLNHERLVPHRTTINELARSVLRALDDTLQPPSDDTIRLSEEETESQVVLEVSEASPEKPDDDCDHQEDEASIEAKQEELPAHEDIQSKLLKKKRARFHTVKVDAHPMLAKTRPPPRPQPAVPQKEEIPIQVFIPQRPAVDATKMLIDPMFGEPNSVVLPALEPLVQGFEFSCRNDALPAVTFNNIHEIATRRRAEKIRRAKEARQKYCRPLHRKTPLPASPAGSRG